MTTVSNFARRGVAARGLIALTLALMTVGAASMRAWTGHAAVSGFVTRSGSRLMLNGQAFRFAGANIYWLGLDEATGPSSCGVYTFVNPTGQTPCGYPSQFRVDDGLAMAKEMGATIVRSHSLGISAGCALCVEPSLGNFNQTALQHFDYAIKRAGDYGIRLIIPLTDQYHYYHGGKHDFTDWRGISDENQFYTNSTVIGDFEAYISTILNHVNIYTGVAYKDDPTIMAWENGNELSYAPVSWQETIADYIRSIDGNHLIADGAEPNSGASLTGQRGGAELAIANYDLYTDHFYPLNVATIAADANQAAAANKVYYVGEYDWQTSAGDSLDSTLSTIESNRNIAGDLFWAIRGAHSEVAGFYSWPGNDTSLDYPESGGDRPTRAQQLRTHAYAMSGLSAPADGAPGTPVITTVNGNVINWQGATPTATYSIERSTTGATAGFSVICNQCVSDFNGPWTDSSQPGGVAWYRMRGYNLSNVAGPYSAVYQYSPSNQVTDQLNDWNSPILYGHSANVGFDTANTSYFNGDASRAYRTSGHGNEWIIWRLAGTTTFQATTYFWPSEPVSAFSVWTSSDCANWTQANPYIYGGSGNWWAYTYTLLNLSNVNCVMMVWNNTSGQTWSPQIGQVTLTANAQGAGFPTSGALYSARVASSGKCLDNGGGAADGNWMTQWDCIGGNTNQAFSFVDQGGGLYQVVNKTSGKCLDNGGGGGNGDQMKQWTCYSTFNNQEWSLVDEGSNRYELVSKTSGKCLDNAGLSANGAIMTQWSCLGNNNQLWAFTKE